MTVLKRSRRVTSGAALATLLACSQGVLGAAVTPPNPKDLTQGTWEMNIEKTHYCPDARGNTRKPTGGGRIIRDVGWDMIAVEWIDVTDKGERVGEGYVSYVYRYDG